jgi:hypothetical protein
MTLLKAICEAQKVLQILYDGGFHGIQISKKWQAPLPI